MIFNRNKKKMDMIFCHMNNVHMDIFMVLQRLFR